jgi:uncharacterized protein (TIGR03083 family)
MGRNATATPTPRRDAGPVPTSLTFDEHLTALERAGTGLVARATAAGMGAPVPTCPDWTVTELVAHQAMVHRWAAAHVRSDNPDAVPDQTTIAAEVTELPTYFREGHAALIAALRAAPADLEAMTFLRDAPPPRDFWARRQAHETTVHMVDALAASLGRLPTAAEAEAAGIATPLALDGIDELLRGFLTRGRSKLYDGTPYAIDVVATDTGHAWRLQVDEKLTVANDGAAPPPGGASATIAGTAIALYLGLWNRGDELTCTGAADTLDRWRAAQQVRGR